MKHTPPKASEGGGVATGDRLHGGAIFYLRVVFVKGRCFVIFQIIFTCRDCGRLSSSAWSGRTETIDSTSFNLEALIIAPDGWRINLESGSGSLCGECGAGEGVQP